MAKTVSMSIGEFMRREEPITMPYKLILPIMCSPIYPLAVEAAAYKQGDMTRDVNEVFSPVFDLMRACGLPVAGIVLGVAAYNFMFARTERGWKLVFGAGIGYVILNLIPLALHILTRIGDRLG